MQKQSGQEVKRKSRGNCTFRRSKEKPMRSNSQRKADRVVAAGLTVHDSGDFSGGAGSVKGEVFEDCTTVHRVEGEQGMIATPNSLVVF